jgi:hypothetical protein
LIGRSVGRGAEAPFTVIASADRGTITEPDRLAALTRWQHRVAAIPGVQTVIGPGQVAHGVAPLRTTGTAILASNGKTGPLAGLNRLGRILNRAAGGVADLRTGISKATFGAGLLADGSGKAQEGAVLIAPAAKKRSPPSASSPAGPGSWPAVRTRPPRRRCFSSCS